MEICGGSDYTGELPEPSRPASRIARACRWCPVTYIGQDAIGQWSAHTWSHWDELVESQLLVGIGEHSLPASAIAAEVDSLMAGD